MVGLSYKTRIVFQAFFPKISDIVKSDQILRARNNLNTITIRTKFSGSFPKKKNFFNPELCNNSKTFERFSESSN